MSSPAEQLMSAEQLTVAAVFWGSAVVIALDAIKQPGVRVRTLGSISVGFVLAGFLVEPLWNVFPDVSQFLLGIATFPPTWFILACGAYLAIRAKFPLIKEAALPVATPSGLAVEAPSLEMHLPDDKIAEIASLSIGQQNTVAQLASISERLSVLEASNAVTASIATKLSKAKRAELVLEKISEARPIIETALDGEPRLAHERGALMPAHIHVANGYHRTLNEVPGFQYADFESVVAKREDAIRNNAVYCTLTGDDAKYFRDGPDKQAYYISRERIVCCKERLDALENEAKNDIALAKR